MAGEGLAVEAVFQNIFHILLIIAAFQHRLAVHMAGQGHGECQIGNGIVQAAEQRQRQRGAVFILGNQAIQGIPQRQFMAAGAGNGEQRPLFRDLITAGAADRHAIGLRRPGNEDGIHIFFHQNRHGDPHITAAVFKKHRVIGELAGLGRGQHRQCQAAQRRQQQDIYDAFPHFRRSFPQDPGRKNAAPPFFLGVFYHDKVGFSIFQKYFSKKVEFFQKI